MLNIFNTFPPQIWRPVTCFLVDGGNIKLLFDTYFLYHYMSQLEIGHPRFPRKADLAWYLICVGTFILVSFGCLFCAPLKHVPRPPHLYCPDSDLHL